MSSNVLYQLLREKIKTKVIFNFFQFRVHSAARITFRVTSRISRYLSLSARYRVDHCCRRCLQGELSNIQVSFLTMVLRKAMRSFFIDTSWGAFNISDEMSQKASAGILKWRRHFLLSYPSWFTEPPLTVILTQWVFHIHMQPTNLV